VVFSQRVLLMESFFSIERGSLMMLVGNCPLVLGGGGVVFSQRVLLVESSFSVERDRGGIVDDAHWNCPREWSFLKECYWWNPPSSLLFTATAV